MFRYSSKSIAAWTIGKIAANHAYHAAKGGGLKLTVSASKCPAVVKNLIKKLQAIESQSKQLVEEARGFNSVKGRLNMTPIIGFLVYCAWMKKNRKTINTEIHSAYSESIADGYIWPSNTIGEVQDWFSSLVENLDEVSSDLRNVLKDLEKKIPQGEMLRRYKSTKIDQQKKFYVELNTFRLNNGNDGSFIILKS